MQEAQLHTYKGAPLSGTERSGGIAGQGWKHRRVPPRAAACVHRAALRAAAAAGRPAIGQARQPGRRERRRRPGSARRGPSAAAEDGPGAAPPLPPRTGPARPLRCRRGRGRRGPSAAADAPQLQRVHLELLASREARAAKSAARAAAAAQQVGVKPDGEAALWGGGRDGKGWCVLFCLAYSRQVDWCGRLVASRHRGLTLPWAWRAAGQPRAWRVPPKPPHCHAAAHLAADREAFLCAIDEVVILHGRARVPGVFNAVGLGWGQGVGVGVGRIGRLTQMRLAVPSLGPHRAEGGRLHAWL
jgi:hypothetical protein